VIGISIGSSIERPALAAIPVRTATRHTETEADRRPSASIADYQPIGRPSTAGPADQGDPDEADRDEA